MRKGAYPLPICISPELPAYQALLNEHIFVMDSDRAAHQDIRALRILILAWRGQGKTIIAA